MLRYGWRYCPVCKDDTHHTILNSFIFCNLCIESEEELEELLRRDSHARHGQNFEISEIHRSGAAQISEHKLEIA
jgi:hypothetical protein